MYYTPFEEEGNVMLGLHVVKDHFGWSSLALSSAPPQVLVLVLVLTIVHHSHYLLRRHTTLTDGLKLRKRKKLGWKRFWIGNESQGVVVVKKQWR